MLYSDRSWLMLIYIQVWRYLLGKSTICKMLRFRKDAYVLVCIVSLYWYVSFPCIGMYRYPVLVCIVSLYWYVSFPCIGMYRFPVLVSIVSLYWYVSFPCIGMYRFPVLVCIVSLYWYVSLPCIGMYRFPVLVCIVSLYWYVSIRHTDNSTLSLQPNWLNHVLLNQESVIQIPDAVLGNKLFPISVV